MSDILTELKDINMKLDDIKGSGFHSMDDIYDATADLGDKLNNVATELDLIENYTSAISINSL